jgi:8-oxo-dGTP diphosphatase
MPQNHIEVIARGLITGDGQVLLCRDVTKGYLFLPGGHVEFGEAAAAALARELDEEAGLQATVGGLLLADEGVFEQGGRTRHELNLVFHVEHIDGIEPGVPVQSREADIAFDWVDLAGIASADVRPASARAFLATGGRLEGPPTASWLGQAVD